MRVCLLVPLHSLVQILVVLLEASKLLPDKHSTTIVEMMGRQVLDVLHALPPLPSLLLTNEDVFGVHASEQ